MDPQGRFTNEYQALRYVNDYADELAAAYGKAEESSRKQPSWLWEHVGRRVSALKHGLSMRRTPMKVGHI